MMPIAVTSAIERAHITVRNCKDATGTRPRSGQCGSGYFHETLLHNLELIIVRFGDYLE
jgi:hypothetical protein